MRGNIEVDVKLEIKDYQKWNLLYVYRGIKGFFLILITVLFILYSIIFTVFLMIEQYEISISLLLPVYLPALLFLLFPLYIYIIPKKYFKSDKFLQEEHHYTFSEDKIIVSSESSHTEFKWDKLFRVVSDKFMFALFTGRNKAFLLPKKCFRDTVDIDNTLELISKKVAKKKLKLS